MRKPNTQITDIDILYRKLRDISFKKPFRSEKYKKFVREKSGKETFHHICGSYHGLKSSDLLGIGLNAEEHSLIQNEKPTIEHIVKAVENLMRYIEEMQ